MRPAIPALSTTCGNVRQPEPSATGGRVLRATGLDLLIGRGVTQTQLVGALREVFALPPDAIADRGDPKLWRAIRTDGWAMLNAIDCPEMFAFAVSVEQVGQRIDWIAALRRLAAGLETVVLWPEEDHVAACGWVAIHPDGRITTMNVAPRLYDQPEDWDAGGQEDRNGI